MAMGRVSTMVDCGQLLQKWIAEWAQGSPPVQQSLGRLLGELDYHKSPDAITDAIKCALESVDKEVSFVSLSSIRCHETNICGRVPKGFIMLKRGGISISRYRSYWKAFQTTCPDVRWNFVIISFRILPSYRHPSPKRRSIV
jgi:hypothetical protein